MNGRPVNYTYNNVPFGAKSSVARKVASGDDPTQARARARARARTRARAQARARARTQARARARARARASARAFALAVARTRTPVPNQAACGDELDPAFAWPAEDSLTPAGNLRRVSTASEIGPADFWSQRVESKPAKPDKMGYVMRLSAGGNIRPRAGTETTPTAPLELTQEKLTATAALRASKSTGQLSAHKAQQRVRAPSRTLRAARRAPCRGSRAEMRKLPTP